VNPTERQQRQQRALEHARQLLATMPPPGTADPMPEEYLLLRRELRDLVAAFDGTGDGGAP
jgi:hypothetical protein